MATSFRIDIYNTSNAKVAEIRNYLSLSYKNKVNDFGLLQFTLDGTHNDISKFVRGGKVIVYRKNPEMGISNWLADFTGVYLAQKRFTDKSGFFTATIPSLNYLLKTRINAYPANTTNFSKFTNIPAETIMKRLVRYNFDPTYATTGNGRIRNQTDVNVRINADQSRGNSLAYTSALASVLEDLQKIAPISGGDFNTIPSGAYYAVEFYPNQLGTNRTSTITFSLKNANMANPVYTYDAIDERTVAIVGGQGDSSLRDFVTRTSPNYASGYDIETFVDARNIAKGDTSALNAAGDKALQDAVAKETFNFKVLQNSSYFYGADYFLGDKVTGKYDTISTALKITAATIKHEISGSSNPESIDLEITPIPF